MKPPKRGTEPPPRRPPCPGARPCPGPSPRSPCGRRARAGPARPPRPARRRCTARICAGPSPPPSCQLSDSPSASCTSGVGGPAKPGVPGAHGRVGGEPVDVVAGQPGVGDGGQARLDREVEVGAAQPAPHVGLPDARDDGPALQGLLEAGLTTRVRRREERDPHVLVMLEDHPHRHGRCARRRARRRPGCVVAARRAARRWRPRR